MAESDQASALTEHLVAVRRDDLKPFPPHFISGRVAIDQFIVIEIVLGYLHVLPSLCEVMRVQRIEAVVLAIVTKDILWHGTNVQVSMVMLKPQVITQDEHLDQRRVCIQLQFDGFAHSPEALKEGNALSHFFPKGVHGVFRVTNRFDARSRGGGIGINKKDFCTEAGVENR